ncbi:MAG: energy-coupling factor transporter transmembrane protein EcfT [Hydrogenibacillus schlegelii]|nr:energy-coupling factor transporter transmembrane protein EcfT [Hydrogenibacillus schlegelii]
MNGLGTFPLGRHLAGDSFLHRSDPRAKLLFLFGIAIAAFTARSVAAVLGLSLLVPAAIAGSGVSPAYVARAIGRTAVLVGILAGVQLFIPRPEPPLFVLGPLSVTAGGLREAVLVWLRLLMLFALGALLTLTTPPLVLAAGVVRLAAPLRRLGVPVDAFGLMLMLALRFIPTLLEALERIMKAQAARGVDFTSGRLRERIAALLSVVVPLFAFAFERAEAMALALEARGYRPDAPRTSRRRLAFGWRDAVLAATLALALAVAVWDRGRGGP